VVDLILLSPDGVASVGSDDQFLAEERAVLDFRHPAFVRLQDCDRLDDGTVLLVHEHVEAECLSERLKRDDGGSALDLTTVCELVGQTATALAAAHQAGLLYLCLRPEHMLLLPVRQAGHPVTVGLLGLGLASHFLSRIRQMAPGKELPASLLRYSSPEQCCGGRVDQRSDIYALGCVLFELLVGQPPFKQSDVWALVSAHAHDSPPRPGELRPDLPPALNDLVTAMLEKDPAQRPFAMGEIVAVLGAVGSEPVGFAPLPDAKPAPAAPLPRTVLLDPGQPASESEDPQSTGTVRPTRLLPSAEEAPTPRQPAIASPQRVRRDQSPVPARRRPGPAKGKGGASKGPRPSRVAMLVGITLVCIALGAGLLLWSRPRVSKVPRPPFEEAPVWQQPISPPPAAIDKPRQLMEGRAAEEIQPVRGPDDKPPSNPERNRVPGRRSKVQDPASPRLLHSPDGTLKPTFLGP
jgi:serine/threonine protein kinase